MRCRLAAHLPTDHPYWISEADFHRHFDQQDFANRHVIHVAHAYLTDWFEHDLQGQRRYRLPTVSVISGTTQFISGRHRTAVLLHYLDTVPIAFDSRFYSADLQTWLRATNARPANLEEWLDLPDLPVRDTLP